MLSCANSLQFLILIFYIVRTKTQDDIVPADIPDFIIPEEIEHGVDKFQYGQYDYIFLSSRLEHYQAEWMCRKNYQGVLAHIEDKELAAFLSEALSETNLVLDTLWVGAKLILGADNETLTWSWISGDTSKPIGEEMEKLLVVNADVEVENKRTCLGFGRSDHQEPQLRPLECRVLRGALCRRQTGGVEPNSTHSGWIKLGDRLYKVFHGEVTFEQAESNCLLHDIDSSLAVIPNFGASQALGRYLLIGRPSLENAWIGARYGEFKGDYGYVFEKEKTLLSNATDDQKYPPWRNDKIQKPGGCLLLDRHLTTTTLFVETRCERLRSYICYKMISNVVNSSSSDVIFGEDGYRIHYNRLSWNAAADFCDEKYKKYEGSLVQIAEKKNVFHLLYVMGENKTAVQHIWIGGKFEQKENHWIWYKSLSAIPMDDSILSWVQNATYEQSVESANLCLNMDRENHITALHYGTNCIYPQSYVCHMTAEKLIELQKDEATRILEENPI